MKNIQLYLLMLLHVGFASSALAVDENHNPGVVFPAVGQKLISPNSRFAVWLEERDQLYKYCIKDRETSTVVDYLDATTTVSALYWTGDSETIVSIVPLSGGPRAFLIHLNAAGYWVADDVNPPSLGSQNEAVISCATYEHKVGLAFGILRDISYYTEGRKYILTFCVDPDTGVFSNMNWESISDKEYSKAVRKYLLP